MKYALLIYEKPGAFDTLSEEEQGAAMREYAAISADTRCLGGERLRPIDSATTVQVENGRTLTTDGPFADTKEILGGFYLVDADGLDEALALAARIPAGHYGGKIEVRPVWERGED